MTFSRAALRRVGQWMAAVVLLAQVVMGAYACPLPGMHVDRDPVTSHQIAEATDPANPCVDTLQPTLCHDHCHPTAKVADVHVATSVTASYAMPIFAYLIPALPDLQVASWRTFEPPPRQRVAAPTSHAVLHCVWRI